MANAVAYQRYEHAPLGAADFKGVYKITLSGSYVQTTGETINLLAASNANGYELNGAVPSGTGAEIDVEYNGLGGYSAIFSGYSAGSFTLQLYSAGTELAAGAYPAVVSGGSLIISVPHRV